MEIRAEREAETDLETCGEEDITGETLSVDDKRLLADTLIRAVQLIAEIAEADTEGESISETIIL